MKNTTAIDSFNIIKFMKLASETKVTKFNTHQIKTDSEQVTNSHSVDRKYQKAGLNPSDTAVIGYYMMGLGDF